jgi:hypothetical protein
MTKIQIQFVESNDRKIKVLLHAGFLSNKEAFISPRTAHKLLQGKTIDVDLDQIKDAAMIAEKQGDNEFFNIVKELAAKKS